MGNIESIQKERFAQADLLAKQGQVTEAIALYESTMELSKMEEQGMIEIIMKIVKLQTRVGQFKEVLRWLKKMGKLSLNPMQKANQYSYKSNALVAIGNVDEGLIWMDKAIEHCEQHIEECESYLGFCLAKRGAYGIPSQAKYWSDRAYAILKDKGELTHRLFCLSTRALVYRDEPDLAIEWTRQGEELALEYVNTDWQRTFLLNRMYFYIMKLDYEKAVETYRQYDKVANASKRDLGVQRLYSYNYMADACLAMGDYYEAIFYAKKALIVGKKLQAATQISSYECLSSAYKALGDYQQALIYQEKALNFFKKKNPNWNTSENTSYLFTSYERLANIYSHFDKEQAELYYKASLEVLDRIEKDRDSMNYFWVWDGLAKLYPNEQGLVFAQKALNVKSPFYFIAYLTMGEIYIALKQYDKAIDSYQKGLNGNLLIDSLFNINNPIFINQFKDNRFAFKCLNKLGQVYRYLYEKESAQDYLRKAILYFDYSFELAQPLEQGFNTKSQILLNDKLAFIYSDYLEVLNQEEIIDFDKIIRVFEACKGNTLHQNLVEKKAKKVFVDKQNIEKEKKLKTEIRQLEIKIQQVETNESEHYELFFDKRKEYQQFIQSLEKIYPQYYHAKYDKQVISLEELQAKLKDNEKLVNYILGKEDIFILYIDKYEQELRIVPKDATLEKEVDSLIEALQAWNQSLYQEKAKSLYKKLMEPVGDLLFDLFGDKEIQDLIIIPYGKLAIIPFEALIVSTENQKPTYLLDKFNISYHYALTLWAKQKKEQAEWNIDFLGVAPIYGKIDATTLLQTENTYRQYIQEVNKIWNVLPFSKIEVEQIAKLLEKKEMTTKTLLHEAATFLKLQEDICQSKIIHFAAHFDRQEITQLSGLVLSGGTYLLIDDVYNLDISAELVVLSACESGVATLSNSEGMMGINRGLLYAGVQNIIATLFPINDKLSSDLMICFYQEFMKGYSIKKALANAKRILIKKQEIPLNVWSSFILFGH